MTNPIFPRIIYFALILFSWSLLHAQPFSEIAQETTVQITTRDTTPGIFLPNQWTLKPAGQSIPLGDLPLSMALSPYGNYAAILHCGYGHHEIRIINLKNRFQTDKIQLDRAWLGLTFSPDGNHLWASNGADDAITRYNFNNGFLDNPTTYSLYSDPSNRKFLYAGGIAIDQTETYAYIAAQYGNQLLRFHLQDTVDRVTTLVSFNDSHAYPYKVILHPNKDIAYVSLWGGKSVAEIQLSNGSTQFIPTNAHPNEMLLTKDGTKLYVACANSNGVDIIDTPSGKVVERLSGSLYPNMPAGSTPNGLALSPDEKTLLVANADNNTLAVFDVSNPGSTRPLGFIPTGWYPTAVTYSNQSEILVVNGKGQGSLANPDGPAPGIHKSRQQYIGGLLLGTLSFITVPNSDELERYTGQAYSCSPLQADLMPVAAEEGNPIPAKLGDPSPIKYCVYIIKENRTYDQVFGDITSGNGDPSLCLFGEDVTPNHHKIALNYVLFDNFYCESEVSMDGHEWTTGAYATDFVEKQWPTIYGGHAKGKVGYKGEGQDPVSDADAGHIWNRAAEAGITYRSYGEWVQGAGPEGKGHTNDPVLKGHINPYYSGFNMDVSDFDRATVFMNEFQEFEAKGEFPQLTIIRLPNDHTSGTTKGKKTPRAYVAENDQALGMILETLSNSTFWREMAIFVIEDDAQNGSDHVDAHRTVAMVASPYVKRNYVDHHMYSTASFLRTMELILGLQPMSQFDAAARPLYACFTSEPDFSPYTRETARVSFTETNGENALMQKESSLLNFEKEDSNPDVLFNEIIWKSVKGADSIMPPPVRAAFVFPVKKGNDEDDD